MWNAERFRVSIKFCSTFRRRIVGRRKAEDNFAMNTNDLQKLAEIAEKTSIWRPTDVTQEPETKLINWQIYKVYLDQLGEYTMHFVGYTLSAYGEGRVCSPVIEFDKNRMRGITRSGRVYELVGAPGLHPDAQYVWHRWLGINGSPGFECITEEFWSDKNK
jgi:hypothetical protein